MSYETILFEVDGGIARLTLNRPDKLNSFNTQMHGEVREALASIPEQRRARAGAHRRRPRLLRRTGSRRSRGRARLARRRSRRIAGKPLQPAGAGIAQFADAGHRGGQRRRRGRGRQHRARLRYRHRGAQREFRAGVLQARIDSRFRRHVVLAAAGRRCAGAGVDPARQQAARRTGRRLGIDLAMRRGRGARRHGRCHGAAICRGADARARRHQGRVCGAAGSTRSRSSSMSSATCSASSAARATMRKASRPLPRSARRASPAAERVARDCAGLGRRAQRARVRGSVHVPRRSRLAESGYRDPRCGARAACGSP